jgi:lipopolysaccharide/colanic/teichoic acid biosynthesis glycosyltransferase/GT2 family glycosyltransferase
MNDNVLLSICIVNYNARLYLEHCLNSILNDPPARLFEIILVDNNSQDGSLRMVEEKFPMVIIIKNKKNEGFIKANNQALRTAKGEYLLCLNNDTFVFPGALDTLIDFMESHPEAGAVGPKVLNNDGTFQAQCKRGIVSPSTTFYYSIHLHRLKPGSTRFGEYLLTYLSPDETHEIKTLSGACMVVRRETLTEVGMMDENLLDFCDDIDWCVRIRNGGWKIYYVPAAQIIHYGGKGGSTTQPYRTLYYYHQAWWRLFCRYPRNRFFPYYSWLVWGNLQLRFFFCVLRNVFSREKRVGSKKGRESKLSTANESKKNLERLIFSCRRKEAVAMGDSLAHGSIGSIQVVQEHTRNENLNGYSEYPFKRAFDILLSLLAMIISTPLWLIFPVAIKLEDGGPIFYRQRRIGKHGQDFSILKFRTLKQNADKEVRPWMNPGQQWVTTVGRILRQTALDELPQVLNILYGDMSFVGPRAMPVDEFEGLRDKLFGLDRRLAIRPGLTGIAQVYGKATRNARKKLKYDLLYIKRQSFGLDLKLIALSFLNTFQGRWEVLERKS